LLRQAADALCSDTTTTITATTTNVRSSFSTVAERVRGLFTPYSHPASISSSMLTSRPRLARKPAAAHGPTWIHRFCCLIRTDQVSHWDFD
jgi:hypothetical protein